MLYPKISIVTPTYNQGKYLEETIQSVITQQYPNLEYIIIDGGSTDNTLEIIKKYENELSYWISEPDKGLYHALQKGFAKSSGDVMGWINSDDLLHRKSLFVLANIFCSLPHVNWLQGHPTVYNETGMAVFNRNPISSKYFFYLKKYNSSGEFVQQESTFWRRCLWEKAGKHISTEYKYAGDFELWIRFFNHDLLYYTKALIGGFRVRANQLSKNFYSNYLDECNGIIDKTILSNEELNRMKKIKLMEKYLMKIRFLKPLFYNRLQNLYGKNGSVSFNFDTEEFNS